MKGLWLPFVCLVFRAFFCPLANPVSALEGEDHVSHSSVRRWTGVPCRGDFSAGDWGVGGSLLARSIGRSVQLPRATRLRACPLHRRGGSIAVDHESAG